MNMELNEKISDRQISITTIFKVIVFKKMNIVREYYKYHYKTNKEYNNYLFRFL
jgi:hypothetical protein